MKERPRTLTIRMTDEELAKAHAVAGAGDESIGRYLRRVIASDYTRRFGDAPPPTPKLKPGPKGRRVREGALALSAPSTRED